MSLALSLSHQGSCQDSCQRVMMTRAAAMIAVMVAGPGGDSLQGPEVLEHGIGPLGRGPHGGQQVVAGLLVRCRAGVLRGHEDADPGALVPLVRQDRHPQPCGPVQGRQHVESGRGQVVGGAGLHRTGVDRESGENPSPPARCRPAPRPRPEYHRWRPVSGLRRGHPVGADQGPVQAGVRLFPLAQPLKDLGKVRGPVGDHAQGWSAWRSSDCGFWWSQAACFRLFSSCSASLGVRYPSAEWSRV